MHVRLPHCFSKSLYRFLCCRLRWSFLSLFLSVRFVCCKLSGEPTCHFFVCVMEKVSYSFPIGHILTLLVCLCVSCMCEGLPFPVWHFAVTHFAFWMRFPIPRFKVEIVEFIFTDINHPCVLLPYSLARNILFFSLYKIHTRNFAPNVFIVTRKLMWYCVFWCWKKYMQSLWMWMSAVFEAIIRMIA